MMPIVLPFALKLTCPLCRSNSAVMHSFFSEIPHQVSRANNFTHLHVDMHQICTRVYVCKHAALTKKDNHRL
jgi:hypothetical protein